MTHFLKMACTSLITLLAAGVFSSAAIAKNHDKTLQAIIDQLATSEAAMRRRLGDDRFDACAARGRAMDDNEIATYADDKLTQVTPQGRLGSPTV